MTATVERMAYRVQEAADLVGMDRHQVGELLLRGEIPSKKVGRARLVPKWALHEWLGSPFDSVYGPRDAEQYRCECGRVKSPRAEQCRRCDAENLNC